MKTLPWLPLLACCACLPAAHDVVGTSCTQTADCGATDLYCVNERCSTTPPASDGGRNPAVIVSENFESGASGWAGITANSQFNIVATRWHSPSHSASIAPTGSATTDPLGLDYALPKPFVAPKTYCAAAWVNTGSISTVLNLTFRVIDGATQYNLGTRGIPLDGGTWQHVFSGPMRLDGGINEAHVRVVTNSYKVGESFFVDDVEVWLTDGGCAAEPAP